MLYLVQMRAYDENGKLNEKLDNKVLSSDLVDVYKIWFERNNKSDKGYFEATELYDPKKTAQLNLNFKQQEE